MNIRVEHLPAGADLAAVYAVRSRVFQHEDHIPRALDFDGHDEAAEQFIAYDGIRAVGTARFRVVEDDNQAKIERVAVLQPYRGHAVGRAIMDEVLEAVRESGIPVATLNSKADTAGFYEKFGFERVGEEFMEAGIPHIKMIKAVSGKPAPRILQSEEARGHRRNPLTPEELAELFGGDDDAFLTTREVARVFQTSHRTITQYAKTGKLPSGRTPGGHRRYQLGDVRRLYRERSKPEAPTTE